MTNPILSCWLELPHKKIFTLAGPMILASISVPLMGLADTAMLGHLDDAAFVGAVAVGANIFAFLFWMMSFLRMGTTTVVGQALGGGQAHLAFDQLAQSAALALFLAAALIGTQNITLTYAISWIAADEQIATLASEYARIRIYAAPAVLGNYILMGWLLGIQKPMYTLVMTLVINATNVILDYIFILELNWGSRGAALASVCADYLGLVVGLLCFYYSAYKSGLLGQAGQWRLITALRHARWKRLLGINRDLFIRTALLLFVFNFFTAQGGTLGQTTLAANVILIQLMLLSSYALDGFAHASETVTAHAVGAKKLPDLHNANLASSSTAAIVALFMSLALWLAEPFVLWLMTDLEAVRAEISRYYGWLCIMPIAGVACYLLDGILIGAGKTQALRNWMIVSVLIVFLPSWWLLQPLGNHGLWFAFILLHLARGASLAYEYYLNTKKRCWFTS